MGDEVQAIKAGLLEVADLVAVTKADRPGADRAAAHLRAMLTVGVSQDRARGDRPTPKRPDVLLVAGATGKGVEDLLAALDRRGAALRGQSAGASSAAEAARLARADAQLSGILAERLRERLRDPAHRAATQAVLRKVAAHEIDPYAAADELLASLARNGPETT
jgi:LAO/AO transport system kinase